MIFIIFFSSLPPSLPLLPPSLSLPPPSPSLPLPPSLSPGGGYRGLSMRRGHYNGRSVCLNYFAKSYNNTIPLIYTHAKVAYNDHNYYKS